MQRYFRWNDSAERMIRSLTIIRKNSFFTGSEKCGNILAVLYYFTKTCRANKISFHVGLRMSSVDYPLHPRKRLTRFPLKTGSLPLLRWINSIPSAFFPKTEKRAPIHSLDLYYTGRLLKFILLIIAVFSVCSIQIISVMT